MIYLIQEGKVGELAPTEWLTIRWEFARSL